LRMGSRASFLSLLWPRRRLVLTKMVGLATTVVVGEESWWADLESAYFLDYC
jgi:hypothetical protein